MVVEFDPTLAEPMELVSWQIGRAAGRLRARIGPRVDVPAFAALVVRLCAGPHPMPPTDAPELLDMRTPVREHWTGAAPAGAGDRLRRAHRRRSTRRRSARIEALVDNLEAAGVPVVVHARRGAASGALPAAARRRRAWCVLAGVAPTVGDRRAARGPARGPG